MSAVLADRAGGPTDGPTVLRIVEVDASPPPGGQRLQVRFGSSQILLATSFLLTWALVYLFVLSGFEQAHHQSSLYDAFRTELALGTAPTSAPLSGSPVALLSIPDAGLKNEVVVEGVRPAELQRGPGHVPGSVLPGQEGISVVGGRSVSFGGPFARIGELRPGDPVLVTTGQGSFVYEVSGVRRDGDPVPAAPAAGSSRLTLRTAARGGLQASETVFVDAVLAEDAAPAGAPAPADPGARLMSLGADPATLALLALSLQVLVVALVGFAWAWVAWSRAAAWIAGAPCVLAALWLASSVGSRLLPGLV
jgi:sortase A